jgi:hypothetical protein
MRPRAEPFSSVDRVASIAMATGTTVVAALLVVATTPARFVSFADTPTSPDAARVPDRVSYVATNAPQAMPSQRATAAAHTVIRPHRAASLAPALSPRGSDSSAARSPAKASTPSAEIERPSSAHDAPLWPRNALGIETSPKIPVSSYSAGGTPLFTTTAASHGSSSVDSALRAVRDKIARSGGQGDNDAKARAQADAAIAANGTGATAPNATLGGISIDAPVPFGGPSNAQRRRDSAINAQTKAVLERVRQRLDSVAAARRSARADSLAHHKPHL